MSLSPIETKLSILRLFLILTLHCLTLPGKCTVQDSDRKTTFLEIRLVTAFTIKIKEELKTVTESRHFTPTMVELHTAVSNS